MSTDSFSSLPPAQEGNANLEAFRAQLAKILGDNEEDQHATGTIPEDSPAAPLPIDDTFVPVKPATLKDSHLDENDLFNLILKFFYIRGSQTGRGVADQIKMPFNIVEALLTSLKGQLLIGYVGSSVGGDYKYELTPKGVEHARGLMGHCTYCGAAPVSLKDYEDAVERQSVKNQTPTYRHVSAALNDLLINKSLVSQVGQAVAAGRSMFLYGEPGNGKTSIATRVIRSVDEVVWIPRTITIGGEVIRLYDPSVHEEIPLPKTDGVTQRYEFDERWVRIKRPTVVVGGELSLKHLEATLNPVTGIIEAPVHVKSNCGCLVVDDFGRQRISTTELLNRWIVPLECGHDFLNLPSGRQIKIPFEQLLVFSTNLEPSSLCDEAFLRRIPYKVEVHNPSEEQFRSLFKLRAQAMQIELENDVIDHLVSEHFKKTSRNFRFCHADDLLRQVRDYCTFHEVPLVADKERIDMAIHNYFAGITDQATSTMAKAN